MFNINNLVSDPYGIHIETITDCYSKYFSISVIGIYPDFIPLVYTLEWPLLQVHTG